MIHETKSFINSLLFLTAGLAVGVFMGVKIFHWSQKNSPLTEMIDDVAQRILNSFEALISKRSSSPEFEASLSQWLNDASTGKKAKTCRLIRDAYCNKSSRLIFDGLRLTTLPSAIGFCTSLEDFRVCNGNITTLPREMGNLTNLESLLVADNRLNSLPEEIAKCTKLEYLILRNNNLTSLPPEVKDCVNLKHLDLSGNKFTSLPAWIGNFKKLERLRAPNNQLALLPDEIVNCTALKELFLPKNNLSVLPNGIGQLTNLTSLDLHSNQLTTLPRSLYQLQLHWLTLSDNPNLRCLSRLARYCTSRDALINITGISRERAERVWHRIQTQIRAQITLQGLSAQINPDLSFRAA